MVHISSGLKEKLHWTFVKNDKEDFIQWGREFEFNVESSKCGWRFIAYRQSEGEVGKLLRGTWWGIRGHSCSTGLEGFVLKPPGFLLHNRLSNCEHSPLPSDQDHALLLFYKHWDKIQYLNVFPKKRAQCMQWFAHSATGSSVQGHLISGA